jgi:uncharacterized membrane protein YkoI
MRTVQNRFSLLVGGASLILLIEGNAFAFSGEKYLSQATVTLLQARQIAHKTYPGRIDSEELEEESGGSGLRYSFAIGTGKDRHEVGVDAKTGKVLENSLEGPNPD